MIRVLPIVIAVEELPFDRTIALVGQLRNRVGYKVHSDVDREGAKAIVGLLQDAGADRVMVDLKIHETHDAAARRAAELRDAGADIITVHAAGGVKMMQAAILPDGPEVYAVTVPTSMDDADCRKIFGSDRSPTVLRLARLAVNAGVTGIVCSPREVRMLRCLSEFDSVKIMAAGSRSDGVDHDDQQNVLTPFETLRAGANYLVIGRQITKSTNSVAALNRLEQEITPVLQERGVS